MEITSETKILSGVLAITVVIIVGGALFSGGAGEQVNTEPIDPSRLVLADSHFSGPENAAITVVEFGDFQCPACGALHPILKQIKEDNSDVKFVYRHFPLTSIHEFAQGAAQASEAAAVQGKFFEYHDQLFENQTNLTDEDLVAHAEAIGLDVEKFKTDVDNNIGRDAVQQGVSDGTALGLRGTPSLFVNGVQYAGQFSVAALQKSIDDAKEQVTSS